MKIACSSESFTRSFEMGRYTQLEWLDACANELEVDGVVFSAGHFPRTDSEYLAQLKKTCVDLGLTVAALAYGPELWQTDDAPFAIALALGAPLVIAPASPFAEDAIAWGAFTESVSQRARAAKAHNVTLAVRNAEATLCANASDLRRLAKDVDSSWLRYAPDLSQLDAPDSATLLPKSPIAVAPLNSSEDLIPRLSRFRAFIVLESPPTDPNPTAYHDALERFRKTRTQALAL